MQGVSALKGLEGPFFVWGHGPSPPGRRLSRVEAVYLHRTNACDALYFVFNAAICNRGSILIISFSNVFEIHRATESLIGFSYRATNSILI